MIFKIGDEVNVSGSAVYPTDFGSWSNLYGGKILDIKSDIITISLNDSDREITCEPIDINLI